MNRGIFSIFLIAGLGVAAAAQDKAGQPPGTVTLPLSDYDRLLERAGKPVKGVDVPPVDAIVSRAEMKLRVADDFVRGAFRLQGEVFRKAPSRVPLISGATLLETTLQNATPPLALENGRHSAILVGPRSFDIDLLWGAPVVTEPGRASVSIPVPLAGSVSLTLDLPGEVSDVRVEPGLITKRTTAAGRTLVEASPDRTNAVRVSWAARAVATTAPRESRFLSDLKTLVTVDETDLRMAVLLDLAVVQGQPEHFQVMVPAGWTLTTASGATLESFSLPGGRVEMNMREPERRAHQVLLGFERPIAGLAFPLEIAPLSVTGAQRETGEIAMEGVGALELTADEKGAVKRMDARETNAALRALARAPLLAAFRYHARDGETAAVAIDVKRFAETSTLAAIADRAEATSLVTTEGRVLTEVRLTVKNHAQPFLRVVLPPGAAVLSAEVEGEGVKPATGEGGTRIPLLRAGFRPAGPYSVSFVYLQTADAFAKRGDGRLALPRLDVPVGLFAWEVFLPDLLRVRDFGGNAAGEGVWAENSLMAGVSGGFEGGTVGGVAGGIMGGKVAAPAETVEVQAARAEGDRLASNAPKPLAVSANVANLQRRVSGVLPVRIDIPRAGTSYRFARPLVVDEETLLTFKYKAK
jgi:hypothetical protein